MKLGIKVGPEAESIANLDKTQAPFCEVWFDINRVREYTHLFDEIQKRHVIAGLHFWGHLSDHTWANIAISDARIVEGSLALIKRTLDIASEHGFVYVNIHPSTRAPVSIDFSTQTFQVLGKPIPLEISEEIFFRNLKVLNDYAKQKNVLLTIETIPTLDCNGWRDPESRKVPIDLHSLPISCVVKATTGGFTIANDFGHTACSIISSDRAKVAENLFALTKQMAPFTKLLHFGFIVPPYNGVDFHDQLDTEVFASDAAVPNKSELLQLLELFIDRDDVYALAEPDGRHTENYLFLKQLIDTQFHK